MSLVPFLKVATLGIISFTVNSFLSYLRLTVKIFQFLRLSTKFLAVLRLSVNPIETLSQGICLVIYSDIRESLCPRQHDMASYKFFSNSKCH